MTDSVRKTLIVSVSVMIGLPLALIVVFMMVDADNESRLEWTKAIGGFGTFAAAIAVVWGFRYTRYSIDNQTSQLHLEHDSRLTEQFHHACSELGASNEFSRISALYEIRDLVHQSPRFFERSIGVICSFIRNPPYVDSYSYEKREPRSDIRVCFEVFEDLYQFDPASWRWYGGNLRGATVVDVHVNGIPFDYWDWTDTTWLGGWIVNLSFTDTEMTGAIFRDVMIRHVSFHDTSLMFTSWDSVTLSYEYHKNEEMPFSKLAREFAPPGLQRIIDEIHTDLANGSRKAYQLDIDGWADEAAIEID